MVQPLQNFCSGFLPIESFRHSVRACLKMSVLRADFGRTFSNMRWAACKTGMAAEGKILHRGRSGNYECEVQYELSFLFN